MKIGPAGGGLYPAGKQTYGKVDTHFTQLFWERSQTRELNMLVNKLC